ncbi:SLAM family member 9 isoform X2 [Triplophysa rosa]|nr:SLAM family member 9 isoform X2 [Triplophysa rosa]
MIFSSCVFTVLFISVKVTGDWHEIKTVMEGNVLNLPTRNTETESLEDVMWLFERGDRTFRIAQMYRGFSPFYDESLTDRVQMDQQTGSLSIFNISTSESGLYTASLTINGFVTRKKIKVDVYASVSVPAISNSFATANQTQGTSQEMHEFCSVVCSVKNDRDVFISWYKGDEIVNHGSSSDLSINLSLPLKLHYNETESYSCTAANPVSNKSIRLHTKHLCPHYEDCLQHCGDVEVLIRLILSALVGFATIVFLLEHMCFWSVQGRL